MIRKVVKTRTIRQRFPHNCQPDDLVRAGEPVQGAKFRCRQCGGTVVVISDDPVADVIESVERLEAGVGSAAKVLSTLKHYETLVVSLERMMIRAGGGDVDDDSLICRGLRTIQDALFRLKSDLRNERMGQLSELKQRLLEGTELLIEFRETTTFVDEEGNEITD